jgi:hypothetical protein
MKGGLDSNTQQYCCIKPSIKTKFETKYVIHLILAIVTSTAGSPENGPVKKILPANCRVKTLQFCVRKRKMPTYFLCWRFQTHILPLCLDMLHQKKIALFKEEEHLLLNKYTSTSHTVSFFKLWLQCQMLQIVVYIYQHLK